MSALTPHDRDRYVALKAALAPQLELMARGLQATLAAGQVLATIVQERLYREEYRTFEAFCAAELPVRARAARHLMRLARAAQRLSAGGKILPLELIRPAHLDAVMGLPEEVAAQVLQEATAGGARPTTERIEELKARALATARQPELTPAERGRRVQANERRELDTAQHNADRAACRQIDAVCRRRLMRLHARFPHAADRLDQLLEAYLAAVAEAAQAERALA